MLDICACLEADAKATVFKGYAGCTGYGANVGQALTVSLGGRQNQPEPFWQATFSGSGGIREWPRFRAFFKLPGLI